MKKFFFVTLFSLFVFQFSPATAQWVTIPDATFAAWLTSNYSSCMRNGNEMDTTCPAILSEKQIIIGSQLAIKNLEGIQYFKSLNDLSCRGGISSIPNLPGSLRFLSCSENQLTVLPTLPDSLWWLECFNNSLTSLPVLPNSLAGLYCGGNSITSLPVLPNSLKELNCSNNSITSLPILPDSLEWLGCSENSITSLPVLPDSLEWLYCYKNSLTSLPVLPTILKVLNCSENSLTSLPALSDLLERLDCYENSLTSLPVLPNSLKELSCSNNSLTSLPALPDLLKRLECFGNSLTSLPALPDSLEWLNCNMNSLTSLPALPDSLKVLYCFGNSITSLPVLPDSLKELDISHNSLTSLPTLPNKLFYLNISNNINLKCFPFLEKFYGMSFNISATGIKCLPNKIQHPIVTSLPAIDTMPICNIFNTNECDIFWNIQGTVFKDDNTDCSLQPQEQVNIPVKVNLYETGNLVESGYFTGRYSFDTKFSSYTVVIDTVDIPFIVSCPASGDTTINVTSDDSLKHDINFAIQCKPGFDVGTTNIIRYGNFFPNDTTAVYSLSGDMVKALYNASCSIGVSGEVKITISGPAKYNAPLPGALIPAVTGDTLVYSVADFSLVNPQRDFAFSVITNITAQIGDQICFEVFAIPVAGDNNPSNNHLAHCFPASNSFDPNEKEVSPEGPVPYPFNDWLTYTIHFQNTGNDSARHIQILDTLDANIDSRSFELLSYSVMPTVQIEKNNLTFNFVNIMLPDSNHSKEGSKGYVSYKVKPKENLAPGTSIKNKASIYFDFNAPIVTNETINTISSLTGVTTIKRNDFVIYPNPAKDEFQISDFRFQIEDKIIVSDLLGRTMMSEIISSETQSFTLSILNYPSGIYLFTVQRAKCDPIVKKFVKN